MYRLTEEGQRYLEGGLPERRLLEILESPLEIKEASEKLEDFNIAMQWAKKEGWVEVKEGKLHLIEKPDEFRIEEALKKVLKKDELDENAAEVLLSRKLIEEIRDDILQRAKKFVGTEITELPEELISTGLWREVKFKPYNVESPGKKVHPGKRQPYQRFVSSMKRKLVELGFV
jgi:phenylalanyl-tRNA synthetase alpha chain